MVVWGLECVHSKHSKVCTGECMFGKLGIEIVGLCWGDVCMVCCVHSGGGREYVGSGVALRVCSGVALRVGSGVALHVGSGVVLRVGSGVALRVGSGVALRVGSDVVLHVGSG